MRNILEEVINEVPHGLFWLNILLPADLAIAPLYYRIAIEAILLSSFF